MSRRADPWSDGVPCWAELNVPDVGAAKDFYRAVLGWEFAEFGEEHGGYCFAQVEGGAAAAIGPPTQPGATAAWTLFIASADADATAEAVTRHGGTVLLAPVDAADLGRMLIASDPAGAVFGVWQAGRHLGAHVVNEPGGISWEDLRSRDPAAALAFYAAVFGYETQPLADTVSDYSTFSLPGGPPLGGIGGMLDVEGFSSHWTVYFGVTDVAQAITAASEAGGEVLLTDFDTPYGQMAGLVDPFGAPFWVLEQSRA